MQNGYSTSSYQRCADIVQLVPLCVYQPEMPVTDQPELWITKVDHLNTQAMSSRKLYLNPRNECLTSLSLVAWDSKFWLAWHWHRRLVNAGVEPTVHRSRMLHIEQLEKLLPFSPYSNLEVGARWQEINSLCTTFRNDFEIAFPLSVIATIPFRTRWCSPFTAKDQACFFFSFCPQLQ